MTRMLQRLFLALVALVGVGCSNNSGPTCSLEGGTQLAAAPWPKFRADTANTGRSTAALTGTMVVGRVLLPQATSTATVTGRATPTPTVTPETSATPATPTITPITQIGPVETTPILGPDSIFVASSDGNVYVIDYQGESVPLEEPIEVDSAITASPLLGANGVLFVASNLLLSQYDADGTQLNGSSVGGFIAGSPNIWNGDGTTFVTSVSGILQGVCPNGVARYVLGFPPSQASLAIVSDPTDTTDSTPIIVGGGQNGQVRAFSILGRQAWSFFASADISAAVLIDESTAQFYVADTDGRVFTGALSNGQAVPGFQFAAAAGITASLALGRDTAEVPTLYVADLGGTLYAIDRATGAVRWTFEADGPISSSPAVATGGPTDVIVFGATLTDERGLPVNGRVYAVSDEGSEGIPLWTFETGSPIGASSPSIGSDGTVYIGVQGGGAGGAVFAIAPAPTASPTPTP